MKNTSVYMLLGSAAIISLIGLSIYSTIDSSQNIYSDTPPPHIKTIKDFQIWRPMNTNATRVKVGNITYFYINNEHAYFTVRRPRTYIFNNKGQFLRTSELTADMRSPLFLNSKGVDITPVAIEDIPNGMVDISAEHAPPAGRGEAPRP